MPHDRMLSVPEAANERWVEVHCDCTEEDHTNYWRLIEGHIVCIAAEDDDHVVYKWQVIIPEMGGRVANGWGHTLAECEQQAEWTAKALHTDWVAFDASRHAQPN